MSDLLALTGVAVASVILIGAIFRARRHDADRPHEPPPPLPPSRQPVLIYRKVRGVRNVSPAVYPLGYTPSLENNEEVIVRYPLTKEETRLSLKELTDRFPYMPEV